MNIRNVGDSWYGIEFKSVPEYFDKEKRGVKSNTVRIVNHEEDKEINDCFEYIRYMHIINIVTADVIIRELSDITRFESHGIIIYIFSW